MDQQVWESHCDHTERAVVYLESGQYERALQELDIALQFGDSPQAHWDRALVLFGLGRHNEAYKDLDYRWQLFNHGLDDRGWQLRRDLPLWRGQSLDGKRLVVVHESGFGDTIQLLRYLPHVQGVKAVHMPPPLQKLAAQFAPNVGTIGEQDYFCTPFDLMALMPRPPWGGGYIEVDLFDRVEWQDYEGAIGITWSSQRNNNPLRSIGLEQFLDLLPRDDGRPIVSLQTHERETAQAHGVLTPVISDFADLAALISVLDKVITIDTAALHVAGAINHDNVCAMLPFVPCWRWANGDWYPNVRQCRQTSPGDWASAFAQL